MSRKREADLRGCVDDELVRVLATADGNFPPPDYIDFLMREGVGPEVIIRAGSFWTLYYPGILLLRELVAERLAWPDNFWPVALESWEEGPAVYATQELALYGFVSGKPEVYRLGAMGMSRAASNFRSWLENLNLLE